MSILTFLLKNKRTMFLLGTLLFVTLYLAVTNPRMQSPQTLPTPIAAAPTLTAAADPMKRLLDKVEHRSELSLPDLAAKKRILSLLPSDKVSGQVYVSSTISIEYISSSDLFQVEILTQNIDQAKAEAVNWFKQSGFSQEAICNYPISFYLNFDIKHAIGSAADSFSPLPPGC